MPRRLTIAFTCVAVLAVGGTAIAQTVQRFSDVPPDHEAFEAVEWAAEAGLTTGYGDGTFKPERSLSKRHAVVFMERFYDDILGAEQSQDFTRGDMMKLLKAINDASSEAPSEPEQPEPDPEEAFGLLVLIASFLGVDVGVDDPLIDNTRCAATHPSDPVVIVDSTDWASDWYAWESCLLGAPYEPITQAEAERLIRDAWNQYLPWTEAAIEASYAHLSNASAAGRLQPPALHVGERAVADICTGTPAGCHISGASRIGPWLDYAPTRIVLVELERFLLLHELAHAIESHQWALWGNDAAVYTHPQEFENERTDGHGLAFRCLMLDLYYFYGSGVTEAAYGLLNGLCRLHAHRYPQPGAW